MPFKLMLLLPFFTFASTQLTKIYTVANALKARYGQVATTLTHPSLALNPHTFVSEKNANCMEVKIIFYFKVLILIELLMAREEKRNIAHHQKKVHFTCNRN